MKRHAAPLLAAVLLILPVLYVGSYLALVLPHSRIVILPSPPGSPIMGYPSNYRIDGMWPRKIFWPLERIDRKLRPGAWV